MHPLAKPRGNLGFPDDPSAQRRRGIAPKNIATFNSHTEALEPMAGALWTSYDGGGERGRKGLTSGLRRPITGLCGGEARRLLETSAHPIRSGVSHLISRLDHAP